MENAIIIRYCEIHLKGKNRGYFEKMLKENIKRSLKGINFTLILYKMTDFFLALCYTTFNEIFAAKR